MKPFNIKLLRQEVKKNNMHGIAIKKVWLIIIYLQFPSNHRVYSRMNASGILLTPAGLNAAGPAVTEIGTTRWQEAESPSGGTSQ